MKRLLGLIVSLFFSLSLYSQSDSLFFSSAIKINFGKYKKESELATRKGDTERSKFLFDSLVDHRLAGTTFDVTTLKKVKKGRIKLEQVDKPIILITYASWCVTSQGEIPALNKLAQKYSKDVKFVVLFWDRRHNVKKIAKKFSSRITVCYAHESYKNDAPLVASLKHTLGLPTTLFLDSDLKIVDIRRCGKQVCPKKINYTKGFALNYNAFLDGLGTILINREIEKEKLAVK
jgi:thiol-disulfide isomerase/thioredoxin